MFFVCCFFSPGNGFFSRGFFMVFFTKIRKTSPRFWGWEGLQVRGCIYFETGIKWSLDYLGFLWFWKIRKNGFDIYIYIYIYTYLYIYTTFIYICNIFIYLFLFDIHIYFRGFACVFFCLFLLVYWKLLKGTGSAYRWYILCTVTSCDFQR